MAAERFVVLGLADARSTWFRELARWATSAALPIEFVKAMSADEVRVRLSAGRPYSALLVDDFHPGLDRDLVLDTIDRGCAVITVNSGRSARSWSDLGAMAELPPTFGPDELLHALTSVARPVAEVDGPVGAAELAPDHVGFRGHLVAVVGSGGTGASTIAMAVAQAAAVHPVGGPGGVCLADLALDADQAMLHASPDVVPGVTELVEAHRAGTPTMETVRAHTWDVAVRHYHLLLGLRRHRDWTALRPRAVDATIDSLRRCFRLVVADIDPDLEGEAETGSPDIEDRNLLARRTVAAASAVVVVGRPDAKGIHSMARLIRDTRHVAGPVATVLPVVNGAPRSPAARAEVTRAVAELTGKDAGVPTPTFLPHRRSLPALIRDVGPLPDAWHRPATRPLLALLEAHPAPMAGREPVAEPVPVAPGTLGSWTDQADL